MKTTKQRRIFARNMATRITQDQLSKVTGGWVGLETVSYCYQFPIGPWKIADDCDD